MEVTNDLQKNCPGVTVTINDSYADYIVMMNRESKQNRGLLRSNSQVQVANKLGDVLGSNATHTVGGAAKDVCHLILADWQEHGRAYQCSATRGGPRPSASGSTRGAICSSAHGVTCSANDWGASGCICDGDRHLG